MMFRTLGPSYCPCCIILYKKEDTLHCKCILVVMHMLAHRSFGNAVQLAYCKIIYHRNSTNSMVVFSSKDSKSQRGLGLSERKVYQKRHVMR